MGLNTHCARCVQEADEKAVPLHPFNPDAFLVKSRGDGEVLVHSGCMRNADTIIS